MPFEGGFTFANFLADVFVIFLFVMWIWLLILVIGDLFRRQDISGWSKALWLLFLLVVPYLGVLLYLITQSGGMSERSVERVDHARDELRRVVGFSVADELQKLEALKKSKAITDEEFTRLRAKLV